MTPRAPEPADTAPFRPQLWRDDSTHSKLSVPLSSQSNEADDEQSLSDPSYDMESAADAPHYEGEDTRLTSDKELSGFYMYGWAAEVGYSLVLSPCPDFFIHDQNSTSSSTSSRSRRRPFAPVVLPSCSQGPS
jgi:hypothetical protein